MSVLCPSGGALDDIAGRELHTAWQQALSELALVDLERDACSILQLKRESAWGECHLHKELWEQAIDLLEGCSKVAVSGHQDGRVEVALEGVNEKVGCYVDVSPLLVGVQMLVPAIPASLLECLISPKVHLEIREGPKSAKVGLLSLPLVRWGGYLRREVLGADEGLVRSQEGQAEPVEVKPVVLGPALVTEPKVEVEAVNVYDDTFVLGWHWKDLLTCWWEMRILYLQRQR